MTWVAELTLAMVISLSAQSQTKTQQSPMWAAISVVQPIFDEAQAERLVMYFGVFNDGSSTVNPNVESSHLFINGVEPEDWSFIIHNGIRTELFYSLPPERSLQFTYLLGRYFKKPGVYVMRWESKNFRSADLTFRVVAHGH